jgi:hypothetical protein
MNTTAFNAFRSNNDESAQSWNTQRVELDVGVCRQPRVFSARFSGASAFAAGVDPLTEIREATR